MATWEHTVETDVPAEAIDARWADVASWPAWDDGIAWARLDGPFAAGSRGKLRPKGGVPLRFRVVERYAGGGFADETYLPGGRLSFEHRIEELGGGRRRVVVRLRVSGPLRALYARTLAPGIASGTPGTVARLLQAAAEPA